MAEQGNWPDFRTIDGFRGEKMRGAIEEVFESVLELLVEEGYLKLENGFVYRTKVEANANRQKVLWAKSREKYEKRLREKVKELLKEIDAENKAENEEYGDKDLEEMGCGGGPNAEKLEKKIEELNMRLKEQPEDKNIAKAVKVMKKDYLPRQQRYEELERTLVEQIAPGSAVNQLEPDDNLREALDIDSFDHLNFLISLNTKLGVDIPEKDYGKLNTVAEIVEYLKPKVA